MNRRDFFKLSAAGALAAGLSNAAGCAVRHLMSPEDRRLMAGLRIIDAHAHPYLFYTSLPLPDPTTPTIEEMTEANVACCAWAAVPDRKFERLAWNDPPFEDTCNQLRWARDKMNEHGVRVVTKAADIPAAVGPGRPPAAILAVEGGDALEGQIKNLDRLYYELGVRMMTLVHYTPGTLGDIMTAPPKSHGLTSFGRKVVERMIRLRMIIDVAHADDKTLSQVVEIAKNNGVPVVDSHGNPFPRNIPYQCSRLRSWPSMELIVKTGGVVCTWPMAYWGKTIWKQTSCSFGRKYLWPNVPEPTVNGRPGSYWRNTSPRETFDDWALEIKMMMVRLGKKSVGLGTDSGGVLDYLIGGYRGYADLPKLVRAMERVDRKNRQDRSNIKAYLGGNFYRVIQKVLG